MKKLLPILFLSCVVAFATAQDVSQTSMPLISKKTATWCGPCGTWGWSTFKTMVDQNIENAILIELHQSTSSKLHADVATALYKEFDQIGSTPAFYVGTTNMTQYSETGGIFTGSTITRVKEKADSMAIAVPINSGFDAKVEGDMIVMDAKVKFFEESEGEYYLGAYVSEKDVLGYQNGIGNDAVHYNILRAAMTTDPFGEKIAEGTTTADTEFDFDLSLAVDAGWKKGDLQVFTVIWKKEENGSYTFQSGYTETLVTSIGEDPIQNQFEVYPTVFAQGENIIISTDQTFDSNFKVSVVNMVGQEMIQGFLNKGQDQIQLNTQALPSKGNYLVVIESEEGIHREMILVR